jgi:hypothetical protein
VKNRVTGLLGCLLLAACDDPLIEAQHVESTRVLGARVEVAGVAERSRPVPGESVAVSWLVADPRPSPPLGWDFVACAGEPTTRGLPRCLSAPFARASAPGLDPAAPRFDFALPAADAFAGTDRVVIRGAICADAEVVLADPIEHTGCAGDLTLVAFEVRLESAAGGNLNPSLADETPSIDGVPWPAPSLELLSREDCSAADATPELPVFAADGATRLLRILLSPDDRELLDTLEGPELETLQVSHFSTLGRLDRAFTVIEPANPAPIVDVPWQVPNGIGAGRIARLYFVARDLRGGVDWAVRTACVVP